MRYMDPGKRRGDIKLIRTLSSRNIKLITLSSRNIKLITLSLRKIKSTTLSSRNIKLITLSSHNINSITLSSHNIKLITLSPATQQACLHNPAPASLLLPPNHLILPLMPCIQRFAACGPVPVLSICLLLLLAANWAPTLLQS